MGRKLLAVVCAVLAVAGAVAGPGYWIYAHYVAGEELTSFDVYRGGGRWHTPARIELSPEMNPVLLRLNVSSRPPFHSGEHSVGYEVTLKNGAHNLVAETVVFYDEKSEEAGESGGISISLRRSAQAVAVFDVPEAGEYVLDVKDVGSVSGSGIRTLEVNRVECVLRRNSLSINPWVCGAGMAIFIAASCGFVVCTGKVVVEE